MLVTESSLPMVGYVRHFDGMPTFTTPVFSNAGKRFVQVLDADRNVVVDMRPLPITRRFIEDLSCQFQQSGPNRRPIYGFCFENDPIVGTLDSVVEKLRPKLSELETWPFVYLAVSDLCARASLSNGPSVRPVPLYDVLTRARQAELLRGALLNGPARKTAFLLSVSTGMGSDKIGAQIERSAELSGVITHLYPQGSAAMALDSTIGRLQQQPSTGLAFLLNESVEEQHPAMRFVRRVEKLGLTVVDVPSPSEYERTLQAMHVLMRKEIFSPRKW